MIRRRTASVGLLAMLAACSSPKKTPILGVQIPVLPDQSGMDVAADAPAVTLPAPSALNAWPQPFANASHAPGNVAGPVNFAQRWQVGIGAPGGYRQPLMASPLVSGSSVFVMDADAHVRALSLTDGATIWHVDTRPKHVTTLNIGGGIAYDSGRIYASTGYGEALALDAESGKILWRQKLEFAARSAPLVAAGLVAIVTQNDQLLTFEAKSGTPSWRFSGVVGTPPQAAAGVTGAPAFADGNIVAGFSTGLLAAVDASSGTPVWEQSLAAGFGQASTLDMSDIVATPVIAGGVVYALNMDGSFMAVDLHSGAKVWTHQASGNQTPAASGGFIFLLDASETLFAVHADDGLVSWATQLQPFKNMKKKKNPINWAGPALINGMLVCVNDHGEAAIVDAASGKQMQSVKLAGPADLAPIAVGGMMLQLTRDGRLTAYG
ncbi:MULTISPECIES: PQQ-binding-like beta-propeller repeat protein [unclassified Acidocella]|uniref:outer membrane protein assembly factor BamB family protein n=1 Tax=unclassified Acidocella TaxID=2648610 RepID=UPI00028E5FCA|nr:MULTISPECIES: PQQ-binding-like beta-propeller repeat protein [unclassified Acidocella]EKN01405.1 pyrrolo-quinoline quinone [Acidocella sp. MX-AZ02]WBO60913.1 PQQ-binding-like beta-propeller repeat protein [Acidocella sp. MX-AZ03]